MNGFFPWDLPPQRSPTETVQCPNCGANVQRSSVTVHACEDEKILEHHTLRSPQGRFAVHVAEHSH